MWKRLANPHAEERGRHTRQKETVFKLTLTGHVKKGRAVGGETLRKGEATFRKNMVSLLSAILILNDHFKSRIKHSNAAVFKLSYVSLKIRLLI